MHQPHLTKCPFSSSFRVKFFLCLQVLLLILQAANAIRIPPGLSIPALFVFGDSIVDTGNNNKLATLAKCDYPPYGRDFFKGQATGRFSNGKVPSDLIADALGIKKLLPAYADPNIEPKDFITGVNFASGGAGFDPSTSQILQAVSVEAQLAMFKEYSKKLEGMVGKEKAKFIIANSLYIMVAGSNDIANTFYLVKVTQLRYNIGSYTDLMIQYASAFAKGLYTAGARRIGYFGAPPLGCVPSQRTLTGGIERACVNEYNAAAELFNGKLQPALNQLQTQLPGSTMVYIDIYHPLLDII